MPDVNTPASPKPTDTHHNWMLEVMGVDPRTYGAAPDAAPIDLETRLKASKGIYDKYGPEAADGMVQPEYRLTPAEQRLGHVDSAIAAATTVDDKWLTRQSTRTTAGASLGDDGKPVDLVQKDTTTVNLSAGASVSSGTTATLTTGSGTTSLSDQSTVKVDLDKGTADISQTRALEQTTVTSGATVTTGNSTTTTVGTGGATTTTTRSTQSGSQLDSTTISRGLQRSDGQLGLGAGRSTRSGTMEGPADRQTMVSGTETNLQGGAGVVSDDKGTGVGVNAGGSAKETLRPGVSLTDTFSAGGRCQSLVKEVPNSTPPSYTITTTISFNVSIGTGVAGEAAPKATPDESGKGLADGKVSGSAGVTAGYVASASFTQTLPADQAQKYLEDIANNGRGGSFPEHQILATGMSKGWEAAAMLYKQLVNSAEFARSLTKGQQVETSQGTNAGAQGALGGGQSDSGGTTVGVQGSVTASHKVTLNETGLGDDKLQVTATIEDQSGYAGGANVTVGVAGGSAGTSHSDGRGHVVVMVLDQKDPNFAELLGKIRAADTGAALDGVVAAHPELLSQSTRRTTTSDGTTVGVNIGAAKLQLGGTGSLLEEQTRDKDGNVIGSKVAGSSQSGGSIGAGDAKFTSTHTEGYAGEVDANNKATGEINQTDTSTSVSKTLGNLGKLATDPLGTVLHPTSLIGTETQSQGLDLADPEIMRYCNEALDAGGWNRKVVGMDHDDWVACGKKIRAAVTVTNGEITAVNKGAVQAALAEWSKSDTAGRNDPLNAIMRPKDGPAMGKAYAWPDGTDRFQPQWKALVLGDPTADATAKLKANQLPEAVEAFKAALTSVQQFANVLGSAQKAWHDADKDADYAEMMGLINTRIADITKALHDAEKKAKPVHAAPTGLPGQPHAAGPPTVEQAAEMEKQQQAQEAAQEADQQFRTDLDTYNNNIEQMQRDADAVFKACGETEAYLKSSHMFDNKIAEAIKMLEKPRVTLQQWTGLYWPTFALYQKYANRGLDRTRIEKLHPAGAQGAWDRIDKMTRDPGMS